MKYYAIPFALLFSFLSGDVQSQEVPPQGISYQAVARGSNGIELTDVQVTVLMSILEGDVNGPIEWQESHTPTTDQFGLFTLVIGQGSGTGVGSAATFGDVDWTSSAHFLRVEIDTPGPEPIEVMGTSELLSVPYALYAATSGSSNEVDGDVTNELITNVYSSDGFIYIEEGGNSHALDLNTLLLDNDPMNELITSTDYTASSNELNITEGGTLHTVDLSDLEEGDWQESADQTMVSNTTQWVGIGTTTPNSTFQVNGSYSAGITVLTGPIFSYQVNQTHQVIICNTTISAVNLTLPAAAACPGRIYVIKKYDTNGFAGSPVNISTTDGDLIEQQSSYSMSWILGETITLISDGDNWWIISIFQDEP